MGVRDTTDQANYSRGIIEALLEGEIYIGRDADGAKRYKVVEELVWLRLRSWVETTGNVDSEGAMTLLDLDRALDKLAGLKTREALQAAAAVSLLRDGFHVWELRDLVKTGEGNLERALRKGRAFILAELRGKDGRAAFERVR